MKQKLLLIGVLTTLSLFTVVSCHHESLIFDKPNQISYTDEELLKLKEIDKKYNFSSRSSRNACSDNFLTNDDIEEMIDVLNKEFGESASKFYGTNIIQKNTNSRAVTTNDGYYNLKIEVECTENWGIWWDYFTTTATLKCYVPNTSIEGRYKPDTGRFKYKDIVNDYSTYVDWVYLAEEVEKYYGKKHTKEEQVEQLDKEIELAKRGSFEYKGKAINGWFPKIGKATYYVEFSAPNKWSQKSISKSGTLIDRD